MKKNILLILFLYIAFTILGSEFYTINQMNNQIKINDSGNGFATFKISDTVYCMAGATARYKKSKNENENVLSKSAAYVEAFQKAKISMIMQTHWNYLRIDEIISMNQSESYSEYFLLKTGFLNFFDVFEISEQKDGEDILVYVSILINTNDFENQNFEAKDKLPLNHYSFEYLHSKEVDGDWDK